MPAVFNDQCAGWEVLWIYSSASVKYGTDNTYLQMFPHWLLRLIASHSLVLTNIQT